MPLSSACCSHKQFFGVAACAVALIGLGALAQNKPAQPPAQPAGDHEREVTADQVPAAALATLKKLAGNATITEFAEEVEHGHTFYEGSWKGATGNVDAVVTSAGDLVVIEEVVPKEMVSSAAWGEVEKAAGKDANLTIERKSMVLYEAHWKTKDGKSHEMVVTPDGRPFDEDAASHGEGVKAQDGDEDEGEKH